MRFYIYFFIIVKYEEKKEEEKKAKKFHIRETLNLLGIADSSPGAKQFKSLKKWFQTGENGWKQLKTIENVLNWLKTIATFKNGKKRGKKELKTVQTDFFLTTKKSQIQLNKKN